MEKLDLYISEFTGQAHKVVEMGLTQCSSGNLSFRADDKLLVSGTGSWLGELRSDQISVLDMETGRVLNGVRPSIESAFHLGILRKRYDINVVLHCQSPFATAVACMRTKPSDFNVTLEVPLYVGREIPVLPYLRPGSAELASAVVDALISHNAIILSNHGQVVCGKDYADALQRAAFLEMACRIIIQCGENCSRLPVSESEYLLSLNK